MKVLWLCNLIPPQAGEVLGIQGIPKEGWVEGLMTAMASSGADTGTNEKRRLRVFFIRPL